MPIKFKTEESIYILNNNIVISILMQQFKKKLNFKEEKKWPELKNIANFMYSYNEKSIKLSGSIRFLLARDNRTRAKVTDYTFDGTSMFT